MQTSKPAARHGVCALVDSDHRAVPLLPTNMADRLIVFDDVKVLTEKDGAFLCRVFGREVWVPRERIGIVDWVVRRVGDHGRLVIPTSLAVELGLS